MLTHDTTKLSLRTPIRFRAMPTGIAPTRRVARVYQYHRDALLSSLVADVCPKLGKRPIAVSCALLWPSSPCPRTDARQVFQGDPPLRAFGFCSEPLANSVVGVGLKAPLTPGQLAQLAFCRQRTDLLKCGATGGIPLAARFDLRSAERLSVAIRGNVHNTEVNAQKSISLVQIRRWHLAGDIQEPFTAPIHQIAFALLEGQHSPLVFATDEGDRLPACDRPDRDGSPGQIKAQAARVIRQRSERLEGAQRFAIELVGVGNFCDASDGNLSAQTKRRAHILIHELVQGELAKGLALPGNAGDRVACRVGCFKRAAQGVGLLCGGVQLDLGGEFRGYELRIPITLASLAQVYTDLGHLLADPCVRDVLPDGTPEATERPATTMVRVKPQTWNCSFPLALSLQAGVAIERNRAKLGLTRDQMYACIILFGGVIEDMFDLSAGLAVGDAPLDAAYQQGFQAGRKQGITTLLDYAEQLMAERKAA